MERRLCLQKVNTCKYSGVYRRTLHWTTNSKGLFESWKWKGNKKQGW